MIVTIHQPNYLPWIGLFSKVKHSDCFVILDTVKYSHKSVINRNKIRTFDGWQYLTIPTEKKYREKNIIDVKLPEKNDWIKKHWKIIEANYKKTDNFESYKDFGDIYKENFEFLWQISEKIIRYLLKEFGINAEIKKASELGINERSDKIDWNLEICNTLNADRYLSGPDGRKYMDLDKFTKNDIKVEFFEFKHPVYKQRYPGFEPYMSAIDLLFNLGEKSKNLI